MFKNWAQPVTHPVWGFIAIALDDIKRASGFRLFVHSAHRAWEKAVDAEAVVAEERRQHPEWYE